MGIQIRCRNCRKKLGVTADQAGGTVLCPKCTASILIAAQSNRPKVRPARAAGPSSIQTRAGSRTGDRKILSPGSVPSETVNDLSDWFLMDRPQYASTVPGHPDPILEKPKKIWYLRHARHGEKGPLKGNALRKLISDGLVDPDSLAWREDWEDWLPAGSVFPEIAETSNTIETPVSTDNPAGDLHLVRSKRRRLYGVIAIVAGSATILALAVVLYSLTKT